MRGIVQMVDLDLLPEDQDAQANNSRLEADSTNFKFTICHLWDSSGDSGHFLTFQFVQRTVE